MSKRLEQEGPRLVFYIDYGRKSEIDDGRRVFYEHNQWLKTIGEHKTRGHKLHRILPNAFSCTFKNGHP